MRAMRLHFKTYGSGYPLVILHGLFGSLNNWATLSRRWGEHFKVYGVDQRNHGHSPHSPAMDYAVMAEDVRELLDHERIEDAHVLGHSMGGKTAMQFALELPDRTGGLVVIDVAPKAYPEGHDTILEAMAAFDPSRYASREEADAALAQAIPVTTIRQFILTNLVRKEGGGYRWKLNLDAIRAQYDSITDNFPSRKKFEKPALFVVGGRSRYVQDADRELITRQFPCAEFTTFPGAGHWIHAEEPEKLFHAVLRFLSYQHSPGEL